MAKPPTLDDLRRYAVARTLFKPTTLARAIDKLGFVQADPIRAPARAQDLTLRHRVAGYRAGDLERRYARLAVEEDCLRQLRLPAAPPPRADAPAHRRAGLDGGDARQARGDVLDFIRARGPTHPRDVEAALRARPAHQRLGRLRAARRRTCSTACTTAACCASRGATAACASTRRVEHAPADAEPGGARRARDALLDARRAQVRAAAGVEPRLPRAAAALRRAAPGRPRRARRSRARASGWRSVRIDGIDLVLAGRREPALGAPCAPTTRVRLLAPFDPIVWDRRRFELLWGWTYRFEAYTPAPKRKLGYYALPLLWRDQVDRLGQRRRARAPPGRRDRLRARPGDERRVPARARRRARADDDLSRPLTARSPGRAGRARRASATGPPPTRRGTKLA